MPTKRRRHILIPPPVGEKLYCTASAYGHPARKRTWLLYFSPTGNPPPELDWRREPGTHQVGWFDRIKPTLSKKAASSTPPAFRDALLSLARSAARGEPGKP